MQGRRPGARPDGVDGHTDTWAGAVPQPRGAAVVGEPDARTEPVGAATRAGQRPDEHVIDPGASPRTPLLPRRTAVGAHRDRHLAGGEDHARRVGCAGDAAAHPRLAAAVEELVGQRPGVAAINRAVHATRLRPPEVAADSGEHDVGVRRMHPQVVHVGDRQGARHRRLRRRRLRVLHVPPPLTTVGRAPHTGLATEVHPEPVGRAGDAVLLPGHRLVGTGIGEIARVDVRTELDDLHDAPPLRDSARSGWSSIRPSSTTVRDSSTTNRTCAGWKPGASASNT